jgi:hypothetical protein
VVKEVVTIERSEHYSYPDAIPNYGEPFKDNWYSFVLDKQRNYGYFSRAISIPDGSGSVTGKDQGDHRFTLTNYNGTIRFSRKVDYKGNEPLNYNSGQDQIEYESYSYSPNKVKEAIGFGAIMLNSLFRQNFTGSPALNKYEEVIKLFKVPYLLWLASGKPDRLSNIKDKFSKINPFYWLTEEDYLIYSGENRINIFDDYYLFNRFQRSGNELISACRLAVTDREYPLVFFDSRYNTDLEGLPSTTERSKWLIDNAPITFGTAFNVTDLWKNSLNPVSISSLTNLSDTAIRGFGFTTQVTGTQGNLEVPSGFFTQNKYIRSALSYNSQTFFNQFKLADIEIYKNRTRLIDFSLECKADGYEDCPLGTALYVIEKRESGYKIKGTLIDLKHTFTEKYASIVYENNNAIDKVNSNGTRTPISRGSYEIAKEDLDVVKLSKVEVYLGKNQFGEDAYAIRPDYTLNTVSLYPIRQPDFYAICLFGMQTYDDRISSVSTPEE